MAWICGARSASGCGIHRGCRAASLPVVTLTRSQVDCTSIVAWPVNDDAISQVEIDPDLLSGRIMVSVDPAVESGDQVSLNVVPDVDWDACRTEWRETVVDDIW